MLSLARTLRQRATLQTFSCRRWFAEVVNTTPSTASLSSQIPVPAVTTTTTTSAVNWRKGRVPVREDHGLYAFFRRKEVKEGEEPLEGEAKYEVFETPESMQTVSGRGWKAEELRLKSFRDLHTLWYVLLRERNLLATQKEETRRMGVDNRQFQVNITRLYHVRKSMARIKQVVNERRLAYDRAVAIAEKQQNAYYNAQVVGHIKERRMILDRKQRRQLQVKRQVAREKARKAAEEEALAKATPKELAARTAAASLFGSSKR